MRLIDADAFKQRNERLLKCDFPYICEETLEELIDDAPTIEERKEGKWIDDRGLYMCSSCGKLWTHWWARIVPLNQMCKELRYCPYCGADMREEKTDDPR